MAQTNMDEFLNSIKVENELNNEKFAKALIEINSKLEELATSGEAAEFIKATTTKLKSDLDKRHKLIVDKFEKIKDSFAVLDEKHELLTKNSDLKIMFNILNENVDHFAQEIVAQKSTLDNLSAQVVDMHQDTSKKDEIIEKVAIVKDGIDEVNRGLQASIMGINSSLRNITKSLMTMDVTDQNDIIKRELENIYMATNAILSSMEIIDQKNDDLAKNVVTKEDLVNFSGKMDNSFALFAEKIANLDDSEKIIAEIEHNRKELKEFNENIASGLANYLSSVKSVLGECVEDLLQNQKISTEDAEPLMIKKLEVLEKLSSKIRSIEKTLASQNESSIALIGSKFDDIMGVIEDFRTFIDSNHIGLQTELVSKLCALEMLIQDVPTAVLEKIDKWQVVLDKSIESVEDVASKNNLKIGETLNEILNLKSELVKMAESFASVSFANSSTLNDFSEKVSADFSNFKQNFVNLSEELNTFKSALVASNVENKEYMSGLMDETVSKINVILAGLKDETSQVEFENLKMQIESLGTNFDALKVVFTSISSENVEKILATIQAFANQNGEAIQKIADIMDNNFQYISKNVETSIFDSKQGFEGLNAKFEAVSSENAEKVVSKLDNLESKMDLLSVDISTDMDTSSEMVKDFIEEYRSDKTKNSEELHTLTDSVKNLEIELVANSGKFNAALEEQLISLNNYVLALKTLCERNSDNKNIAEYAEKMLAVETALHTLGESFGEDLTSLQSRIAEYSKAVADISFETKAKLTQSLDEMGSIKSELANVLATMPGSDDFTDKINNIANIIFAKIENLSENITDLRDESKSGVDNLVQSNLLNIEEKFAELQRVLNEKSEKMTASSDEASMILAGRIDDLKQEIGLVNADLSEIMATKSEVIVEKITPLKESIDNFLNTDFDKVVSDIKSQIELSYLNFSADLNESLAENHDSYVHLEDAYKVIIDNFGRVQEVIRDFNENQASMIVRTVKELDRAQSENFEKANSLLVSWKEDLSDLENKFELSFLGIESSINRSFESIEADKKELKEALSETLKKDEFDGAIFAQTDELRNALAMETEKSESALGGLKSLVEDLSKKSDSLAQAERIDDLMKSLNAKIDVLATSGEADKVQEMLSALHEKVDIIAMSEDESKFVDLEEIIQALHEKVDIIAMSDESSHIEDLVQALHDKVDVIAATDDAELYNEIQDIKDLIDEQRKQIEAFGSEDSDLDKRLQTLQTEISNIDFAKSASDIKDTVMNAMLAVTDQITFVQETEEIKGFVEERTEEINKNLLDVKKQLCSMASGSDVWDYSYTMQDIESDIAKLRLILNDISASTSKEDLNDISKNMHKLAASVNNLHSTLTEEQIHELRDNVSKINEDVVSLSTRTNKLLLNSDESHRALTDGLDELNKVLAMFGSTASGEALQDKLDRINAAIANSANTDNIMKEVMLYLGEWIDDAGEKINTIASDTANLSSINSELCYLKTMMGNSDIIESIRQKFEVQQNRIDVLETKLDRVLALLDTGKIESLEDKVDDLSVRLFEKMRGLDTKLNKLTDGIEKLASYVDEE